MLGYVGNTRPSTLRSLKFSTEQREQDLGQLLTRGGVITARALVSEN